MGKRSGKTQLKYVLDVLGEDAFIIINILAFLILGWPLYLINNVTGGQTDYNLQPRDPNMFIDHFTVKNNVHFSKEKETRVILMQCKVVY